MTLTSMPRAICLAVMSLWAFAAAAQSLAPTALAPLKLISDSREGGRERYGTGQILIRPDQFVAWIGSDQVEDPVQILKRATGARSYTRSEDVASVLANYLA